MKQSYTEPELVSRPASHSSAVLTEDGTDAETADVAKTTMPAPETIAPPGTTLTETTPPETMPPEATEAETMVSETTAAPATTSVPETTAPPRDVTEPATESEPQTGTVYWVAGGEVWHLTSDCSSLSRSKNILSGTVDDAIAAGKARVCKRCSS